MFTVMDELLRSGRADTFLALVEFWWTGMEDAFLLRV